MSKKVSQSNIIGWKTPETRRVSARKLSAGCKLERIVIHELADHLQNVAAMDQSQYVQRNYANNLHRTKFAVIINDY